MHQDKSAPRYFVVMKGAPEIILSRCSTVAIEKKNITLTSEMKAAAEKTIENLANTGTLQ